MPPVVTSSRRRRDRQKSPHRILAVVTATIFCVAGVFCAKYFKKPGGEPPAPMKPIATTGETPALPEGDAGQDAAPVEATSKVEPTSKRPDVTATNVASHQDPAVTGSKWSAEQRRLQAAYVYPTPGQARLDDGKILTFSPPAPGHSVKFRSNGKEYECFNDGTFKVTERRRVFEDPFEEQLIALATPGATFVPFVLLNHTEEELKSMLERQIVINEDDPEDVREKKELVASMKSMIMDYLEQGGDYVDFIERMQQYSVEERNLRTKGMMKIHDLVDDGDVNGAKAFLKTYNEILDEQGFAPLDLPAATQKLLDETE